MRHSKHGKNEKAAPARGGLRLGVPGLEKGKQVSPLTKSKARAKAGKAASRTFGALGKPRVSAVSSRMKKGAKGLKGMKF